MPQKTSLVSCLLIAGMQYERTARAIYCYQQQDWNEKELILIDYGSQDLTPLLEDMPPDQWQYIRRPPEDKQTPGAMKNTGLDYAKGAYIIHWNENDWHHPERIRHQADTLMEGYDICWLGGTLIHLDHPEFVHHPYVDKPSKGYIGSMMYRNHPEMRFDERKKDPDPLFLSGWETSRRKQIDIARHWLLIRSVSGETRSKVYKRFLSGYRNTAGDLTGLAWLKIRGKDVVSHSRFKLTPEARESFQRYLRVSGELGLITSIS